MEHLQVAASERLLLQTKEAVRLLFCYLKNNQTFLSISSYDLISQTGFFCKSNLKSYLQDFN